MYKEMMKKIEEDMKKFDGVEFSDDGFIVSFEDAEKILRANIVYTLYECSDNERGVIWDITTALDELDEIRKKHPNAKAVVIRECAMAENNMLIRPLFEKE